MRIVERELGSIGVTFKIYHRAQKFYADLGITFWRMPKVGWIMSKVCGKNGICFILRHTFGLDRLTDVFDAPSVILADFAREEADRIARIG